MPKSNWFERMTLKQSFNDASITAAKPGNSQFKTSSLGSKVKLQSANQQLHWMAPSNHQPQLWAKAVWLHHSGHCGNCLTKQHETTHTWHGTVIFCCNPPKSMCNSWISKSSSSFWNSRSWWAVSSAQVWMSQHLIYSGLKAIISPTSRSTSKQVWSTQLKEQTLHE